MQSVSKSNISWFILFSLFGILLPYATEETKHATQTYSMKELQNDFIGLWKNPQKYVEFQLNAEDTSQPDAGGLYELRPYYQKINALGEKTNYAIQWCAFENKWQLVEANQIGLIPSLDNELSTIATLLEGDHFSRPTKADIKAYTTYEQMKSAVNTVGIKNKELKIKIIEMEIEVSLAHAENEKLKTSIRGKIEAFEILKVYTQKANEVNESKTEQYKKTFEEYQQNLEEMELLKLNLNKKEIQILNNNESIVALQKLSGCQSYQLSMVEEHEQQFKRLQKDAARSSAELKQKTEKFAACENKICELEALLIKKNEKIYYLQQKTLEHEDTNDFKITTQVKKQIKAITQCDPTLDVETMTDKLRSIIQCDEDSCSKRNMKRCSQQQLLSKKKQKEYRCIFDDELKSKNDLHQLRQEVEITPQKQQQHEINFEKGNRSIQQISSTGEKNLELPENQVLFAHSPSVDPLMTKKNEKIDEFIKQFEPYFYNFGGKKTEKKHNENIE